MFFGGNRIPFLPFIKQGVSEKTGAFFVWKPVFLSCPNFVPAFVLRMRKVGIKISFLKNKEDA